MTISNQNYRNEYTLNESRTSFPYTFKISADSDLLFRRYDTNTGTFTTLTLNSDYTVTGAGVEGGGTITYAGAASYDSDYKVIAERNVPYTQTTDLINNDDSASFNETLEDTFDRLTMLIQQLLGQQDRTLKLDASVGTIADIVAITAGYLYWNGTSFDIDDAVETDTGDYPGTIDAGLDAAKSASPSRNDLYFAYDSNKLYKCLVNGSWSNVWVLGDTTAEDLTATSLTVGNTVSSGDVTISGNLSLGSNITINGVTITGISTDGTLAANSDSLVSTMKSVKTYADTKLSGFGAYETTDISQVGGTGSALAQNTEYQAEVDGEIACVAVATDSANSIRIETGQSSGSRTTRIRSISGIVNLAAGASLLVKKDEYWQVVTTSSTGANIYFRPIQ